MDGTTSLSPIIAFCFQGGLDTWLKTLSLDATIFTETKPRLERWTLRCPGVPSLVAFRESLG